jgi:hypothetical protein
MEVVGVIISDTHSVFIKGRNIIEGLQVLHEAVHELKVRGQCEILLKFDF